MKTIKTLATTFTLALGLLAQVATAAPTTPIFGAPRLPKINTQFSTRLVRMAITLARMGARVSPVSRRVLA